MESLLNHKLVGLSIVFQKWVRFTITWRPITLLNLVYTFYSGISAERFESSLPELIHPDQIVFINWRFLDDHTRLPYITEMNKKNESFKGLIILTSYEKAFDAICWDIIMKTLQLFDFKNNTLKCVRSMQT